MIFCPLSCAIVLNASFMMIFLGARMTVFHSPSSWIALDALIVLASLWLAKQYAEEGW